MLLGPSAGQILRRALATSCLLGGGRDFLPFPGSSRLENRVANQLSLQGVAESWRCGLAFGKAIDEVGYLVNETMFVANLQAGHPPFVHVRMVSVGDVNCAPAAHAALVAMFKVLQAVQSFTSVIRNLRHLLLQLELEAV